MTRIPSERIAFGFVACLLLASCAGRETRDADAVDALGTGSPEGPGDVYVAMAGEYLRRGQLDVALRRARKGVEEDGGNARAHYMLALVYERVGEAALAERHFGEAVRLAPQDPMVRNAWGTHFCRQKRYREAQEQFDKAASSPLYRTPWVALTNAGTCARQAGDRAKAESYLRRALEANPRFGPSLLELASLSVENGDYGSARTYLDDYFQSASATPEALALAVRVERRLGSRERAADYEQMLRESFPTSPETESLHFSSR